jgi:hypothetical protein
MKWYTVLDMSRMVADDRRGRFRPLSSTADRERCYLVRQPYHLGGSEGDARDDSGVFSSVAACTSSGNGNGLIEMGGG